MPEPTDERPQQDYADAYYSLRAPRVAIVFPADTPHWDFFARKALWRANRLWGGAGFVLVPHQAGVVSETLLRAVASYDPDYVVGHQVSWVELLTAYPKARDMFVDQHGQKITLETFDANDSAELAPADDPLTAEARRRVAVACQVYRRRHEPEPLTPDPKTLVRWDRAWSQPDESHTHLDDSGHLTATSVFRVDDGMCLATPSDLAGPWGAWTAALIGAVAEPDLPVLETADALGLTNVDAEGAMEDSPAAGLEVSTGSATSSLKDAAEITAWFYSYLDRGSRVVDPQPPARFAHHHDGLTLAVDASTLPAAWDRTTQALVPVGDASARRRITVVVGDTADDFALALIYQRLYANTFWIHSAWSPTADGMVGRKARTRLSLLGYRVRQLGHAVVTSASEGAQALDEVVEIMARNARDNEPGAASPRASRRSDTLRAELPAPFPDRGMLNLAVTDEYSTRLTVPVLRDEKAVALTATPPALRSSDSALVGSDVAWHVDLRLDGTAMPLGRGLDGEQLAASQDSKYETWIRSGNRGVSYESRRWDFVAAGANAEQRLARPRLRMLSLQEWCRVIAAQVGYDVGWSDAGRRARLLERMWGSRRLMTADFAGAFTELARAFSPAGKSSREAYPDGDGVLLTGLGGFLTFPAVRDVLCPAAATAGKSQQTLDEHDREARERLDTYLTRGIIRRGLILGCRMCEAPSFVPVDDVAQVNRCPRCGSLNDLTLDVWRAPAGEPQWYYDLHQVARDFLRDNGHAPAQLAHHLSRKARNYADCAEMNLLLRGTRTSIAEVDLVAYADGHLLTAEVKTCDYIGNSTAERTAAANKRLHWAAVLQADEVVLASTEASWQASSIEAMRTKLADAIAKETFAPDRTPRLRLINNLGAADHAETYVDV
ncbi:hypothetical protein [Nocardioides bruguierae]|uniref:hypothetical protein n=1 Tax=Nocardioides bruguierae TaxID=2945102 RepID=UPI00201FD636|nr:hypothetical protein [Nocardioides bruguierae]MCL8026463.1 hypothetical protein [Nocardioides bruguierae]